jgi:hypothetical protein
MASLGEPSEPSTFVRQSTSSQAARYGLHGCPPRSGTFQPLRAREGHAERGSAVGFSEVFGGRPICRRGFLAGVLLHFGLRSYPFEVRLHAPPMDRIWTRR